MRYIFYGCSSLLSITGLSNINTSNVIFMNDMFEGCSLLEKINDISKWDINKVKDISNMFSGCSSLKSSLIYLNGIQIKLKICKEYLLNVHN